MSITSVYRGEAIRDKRGLRTVSAAGRLGRRTFRAVVREAVVGPARGGRKVGDPIGCPTPNGCCYASTRMAGETQEAALARVEAAALAEAAAGGWKVSREEAAADADAERASRATADAAK